MSNVVLCNMIKDATRQIMVIGGGKLLSLGTGVTIHETGLVLTSGHVICDDSGSLSGEEIIVETDENGFTTYTPFFTCDLRFDFEFKGLSGKIGVDLNILQPSDGLGGEFSPLSEEPHLPLAGSLCEIGEGVIIAGYPDEISPQPQLDEIVSDLDLAKISESRLHREMFMASRRVEMLKQGMVGNVQQLNFDADMSNVEGIVDNVSIRGAYYGIDTHLSEGGSGGPVVNSDGEVAGVVVQRGKTNFGSEILPSLPADTGVAVSHDLVSWALNSEYRT